MRIKANKYEIYESSFDEENILDTVFNEEHYNKWVKLLENAADLIWKRIKQKPTKEQINKFLKEKNIFHDVTGIKFQDIQANNNYLKILNFHYKKKLQLVIYDLRIMLTFNFLEEGDCDD